MTAIPIKWNKVIEEIKAISKRPDREIPESDDKMICNQSSKVVLKELYPIMEKEETKPLLLFDLNGVLCVHEGKAWKFRKDIKQLLTIVEKVFCIGIYSSRKKHNVDRVVNYMLQVVKGKRNVIEHIFHQDHCKKFSDVVFGKSPKYLVDYTDDHCAEDIFIVDDTPNKFKDCLENVILFKTMNTNENKNIAAFEEQINFLQDICDRLLTVTNKKKRLESKDVRRIIKLVHVKKRRSGGNWINVGPHPGLPWVIKDHREDPFVQIWIDGISRTTSKSSGVSKSKGIGKSFTK